MIPAALALIGSPLVLIALAAIGLGLVLDGLLGDSR